MPASFLEREDVRDHVYPWRPQVGRDEEGWRSWRRISLLARYWEEQGDPDEWEHDAPCTEILALGHDLPRRDLLEAVAAHASWDHETPRPVRDGLTFEEAWVVCWRHRRAGCLTPQCCETEDCLYVVDAQPGDYQATAVTRIRHPELGVPTAAA